MSNHVHLAVQVGDVSLSRILQNLSFRYTRWVNWRQNRSGHLFQGRYKAVLVDADVYLQQLTRYIHLNPVRSGMVKTPRSYAWSGHRAYLGLETISWLTTEWVLSQFSARLTKARRAYERFVMEGQGGGRQEEYHRGSGADSRILGDDTFIDRVLDQKRAKPRPKLDLRKVVKAVCREYAVKEKDLALPGKDRRLTETRAMVGWLIMGLGVSTLGELGEATNRDATTLSSAVRRLGNRAKRDSKLEERMRRLLDAFC
jgi:putative transposase